MFNKTRIEWCDFTWNPVTGCLHGCDYCYARRIAERFGGCVVHKATDTDIVEVDGKTVFTSTKMLEINEPMLKADGRIAPYPIGFKPTFHRYRLEEPKRKTKHINIFVSSMGDLFGDWIPDEWIEDVYMACQRACQHTYMFLTKNPKRYSQIYRSELDFRINMWFGTTVTDEDSFINRGADLYQNTGLSRKYRAKRFLSIEPLLGPINEWTLYHCLHHVDWVIIGGQTGPGAVPPNPEWVQNIIDQCRDAGVPVFLKNNLNWPEKIQEWPEELS